MKYATFIAPDSPREPKLGAMLNEVVIDLHAAQSWAQGARSLPPEPLPPSLFELIHAGQPAWLYARNLISALDGVEPLHAKGAHKVRVGWRLDEVQLFPPLPRPMSLRDFYGFENHVKAAYSNIGRDVPEVWYEFPAFYYTSANSILGTNEPLPYPKFTQALDFELEIACVVGKIGRDIPEEKAHEYIFGYMIMNDWSARDLQKKEMKMLGPAKSKDFATSLGPCVVTPDELSDRACDRATVYDLQMAARVNGVERSRGNFKDIHYTFAQMIARASEEAFLMPGDVIGSGTVGTGCLLELTKGEGPWLQSGDVVELEIERLGVLRNKVISHQ
jgi:fumarylacetoacetate (FAA) hydrolase